MEQIDNSVSVIKEEDGFVISDICYDLRLRTPIYKKLLEARNYLPKGYSFMVVEAYRSIERQIELWNAEFKVQRGLYPEASEEYITQKTGVFVANPNKRGSGHQVGCAIDLTICDENGQELDMGTKISEFSDKTQTENDLITAGQRQNRALLRNALEKVGFVNYPAEWWHYCYGDSLWSHITGEKVIFESVLGVQFYIVERLICYCTTFGSV